MVLVETSAWVEYLRDTGSPVCERVDQLLREEFATCAPVRMELLAGARDERHLREIDGLLALGVELPTLSGHYDTAAALYRACRRRGLTVRKLIDCLIAAHAIDADVEVLQADADFEAIARCSDLRLAAAG